MKITPLRRVAPDDSHVLDPALFGEVDRFELSTIWPEDSSIAIEMLIGNYASPMDAVIRELYVNASDSHRAAGQTRPVEITMPTEESPFLVVRDFGIGMSPDDMVDVFTRPAASTKRGENTSAGGLGIGAKAPFTVADRFVVRGVKDGIRATLVMARIDGHLMHLVDEVSAADVDAPNSVEITVPIEVSKIFAWWKALSRVHFWWDEGGAVITNRASVWPDEVGALMAHPVDSPVKLPTWTERILEGAPTPDGQAIVHSPQLRKPTVLMGQIAYAIPESVLTVHQPLLYVVPVGTVRIAPNRESIVDTEENREVLRLMTHAWQHEQFSEIAETILDPTTSVMTLAAMDADLHQRRLRDHFQVWAGRVHPEKVSTHRLPRQGFLRMATSLAHTFEVQMRNHGVPGETAARAVSLDNMVWMHSSSPELPRVFVDSRTLPEARRRILTSWARTHGVVAVVVDRHRLEEVRFLHHWGWSDNRDAYTRPFAAPGEIEWIDPMEVRIERAPSKSSGPAPTGSSLITFIDLSAHSRPQLETTVDELVSYTKQRTNRWVIVDTLAEISKIDATLPTNICAVASGQRPAALVKRELGARAITVAELLAKQTDYVMRSLTKAQRRFIADLLIARLDRIQHYFGVSSTWIEETKDPAVREVAMKIATIVRQTVSAERARDRKGSPALAGDYVRAIGPLAYNQHWLIENASLGKYAPALLAAQSNGLSRRSMPGDQELVIEHIRDTIATQLVAS